MSQKDERLSSWKINKNLWQFINRSNCGFTICRMTKMIFISLPKLRSKMASFTACPKLQHALWRFWPQRSSNFISGYPFFFPWAHGCTCACRMKPANGFSKNHCQTGVVERMQTFQGLTIVENLLCKFLIRKEKHLICLSALKDQQDSFW